MYAQSLDKGFLWINPLIFPVAPRLGLKVNPNALQSATRGLVGATSFAVLPNVGKRYTFGLSLAFMLVSQCRMHQNTY